MLFRHRCKYCSSSALVKFSAYAFTPVGTVLWLGEEVQSLFISAQLWGLDRGRGAIARERRVGVSPERYHFGGTILVLIHKYRIYRCGKAGRGSATAD